MGRHNSEDPLTDSSRASNMGLLRGLNDTPVKNDPFEVNITSTLNIVQAPAENYLEPPDEEYDDEEEDEQEA
jgi:hypothetical protein